MLALPVVATTMLMTFFDDPLTFKEPQNKSWHTCLAPEIAELGVTNLANSSRYCLRRVP